MNSPQILGPDGNPARSMSISTQLRRPYEGASRNHSATANWNAPRISGQSAAKMDRAELSARIHDLVRNDGPTGTAVEKKLNSVVGAHWQLSAKPNALRLGLDDTQADEVSDQIEAEWKDFAHEHGFWCDQERDGDMDDLLNLCARHLIMDGEAFAVMGWRLAPTGFNTCLQIVHPARCSNPNNKMDTETLRDGCELDTHGATSAYWFRSAHPGDTFGVSATKKFQWKRYERETPWGRPRVLHVRMKQEAGMKRAVSDFASVLRERKQGHLLSDYELQASMLNAVSALFIETPLDAFDAMDSITPEVATDAYSTNQEVRAIQPIRIEGVQAHVGGMGEKFQLTRPEHPNPNFEPFMQGVLRSLAARMGITYEQLTGDWSNVNYSSARAAILEVAKGFVVAANLLKKQFMGPIYRAWLEEAFEQGRISIPDGVPGFIEMPEAWSHAEWIGAGKGYVDPEKEVKAALLRIAGGLSSLEKEVAEQGGDYKSLIRQRARERALAEKYGEDPHAAANASKSVNKPGPNGGGEAEEETSKSSAKRRNSGVPLISLAA